MCGREDLDRVVQIRYELAELDIELDAELDAEEGAGCRKDAPIGSQSAANHDLCICRRSINLL